MDFNWLFPFTLIPGTAMLVLSTANRFHHVNGVIRSHCHEFGEDETVRYFLKRTHRLYFALVGLYCAIANFAISALLVNVGENYFPLSWIGTVATILQTVGVGCVVFSAVQLIFEALMAYEGIQREVRDETKMQLAAKRDPSKSVLD